MRAFHRERNRSSDEIAARQLDASVHTGKLRLFDVKEVFLQMKDFV
jgi:hypothetical protein